MAVIITDEAIINHCRSRGMDGPISNSFLDEYRRDLGVQAVCAALSDAGAMPGTDFTDLLADIVPAAEAKLRELVEAL